jgi:hypothetical protein
VVTLIVQREASAPVWKVPIRILLLAKGYDLPALIESSRQREKTNERLGDVESVGRLVVTLGDDVVGTGPASVPVLYQ